MDERECRRQPATTGIYMCVPRLVILTKGQS